MEAIANISYGLNVRKNFPIPNPDPDKFVISTKTILG